MYIIFFDYVDFWQKIYLILYLSLRNLTSHIAIMESMWGGKRVPAYFFLFWEQTPLNFDHFEWACEGMDRDAFDHSSVFNST